MKEPVLLIIKPDGLVKGLVGAVFNKFRDAKLKIIALKIVAVSRELAEAHYRHIKGEKFYSGVINYLLGKYHRQNKVIAVIYYGEKAVLKCRKIAGATNPEDATPDSIRGAYGRITTKGVFENIVHVSSSKKDTKREIQLWFEPDEILSRLYPTKSVIAAKKRVWV